jgi:RNA polymerase sigma-70 factor (ECF subfamily)
MDVSDTDIVKKVQNGDVEAFGELVIRYEKKIDRYLSKFLYVSEDAEDILQDVFLKVYSNIQSFDTTQPFSPWIYRIAHNEAINFLKKRKPASFSLFDVDVLFPHPIAKEETHTETEKELTKKMLDKSMDKLDIKYKEVLLLYFYEDMSYKEISQTLHIPVSSVGVRITRGKEKLEKIIQEIEKNIV